MHYTGTKSFKKLYTVRSFGGYLTCAQCVAALGPKLFLALSLLPSPPWFTFSSIFRPPFNQPLLYIFYDIYHCVKS